MFKMLSTIGDNVGYLILFTGVLTNLFAQITKFFIYRWKYKSSNYMILFSTGGMPSSHTAFITSVVFSIGVICGTNSVIFALALSTGLIVIFDSLGIRRQAGKQAQVLNKIVSDFNTLKSTINKNDTHNKALYEKKLKEFLGHEPIEVLGGILFGILVTSIILWLLY